MKTSANLAACSLSLLFGLALLTPESTQALPTPFEPYGPKSVAFQKVALTTVLEASVSLNTSINSDFATETNSVQAGVSPADVEYPDARQKITFTAIAGTIAFLFLFLALLDTKVVRDNEYFKTLKLNVLSPVKLSVLISFYLILTEFLLCFWIQGSIPKLSPGLLIFAVIAFSTAIFHHLLKLRKATDQHRKFYRLHLLMNALIPMSNVLITLYLLMPAIHQSSFNEVPEFIIIPYLILSLLHVGIRAFGSSVSGSAVFKQMVHPEFKKNITI